MRQTLNFKIYQDLYNKIRSHFYKPGEQLPTESALHFCFQLFTMGKHAFNERFWRTLYRQKSR